jgi:hypothetical protein
VDNLRNFFLTTTTEVLSFSHSCEQRQTALIRSAGFRSRAAPGSR